MHVRKYKLEERRKKKMNDQYTVHLVSKDEIVVSAKYVKDENGFVFFYMEEDRTDIDQPVEVFAKETVQRIVKTKEEETKK